MKRKRAFGAIEILIALIIIVIVYFTCFHGQTGRKNPFEETKNVRAKQQVIDDKIEQIEADQKLLKEQIKRNLDGEY